MTKIKNISKTLYIGLLLAGFLPVTACSNASDNLKDTLGLNKESPDEFTVITRAPLEMPSDFSALPPPMPGIARAQEKSTIRTAKEAIFGENVVNAQTNATSIETMMLEQAGADSANKNIRSTVDQETLEIQERNTPVAQKLLKMGGKDTKPIATIVDSQKEYERIKKNQEEGKSILEGDTPTLED